MPPPLYKLGLIQKSTNLWIIIFFRKVPPCYPSDIVGPLKSALNQWKLVCYVPQGSGILLLINSGVCIVILKQPSNKSFFPFQKSEINKWDTDDYDQEVWKNYKLLEGFPK